MPFGFGGDMSADDSVKTKKYAKRPLSRENWETVVVGLKVQSILTDVKGEVTKVEPPFVTITWSHNGTSRFKINAYDNVSVIDEQS